MFPLQRNTQNTPNALPVNFERDTPLSFRLKHCHDFLFLLFTDPYPDLFCRCRETYPQSEVVLSRSPTGYFQGQARCSSPFRKFKELFGRYLYNCESCL